MEECQFPLIKESEFYFSLETEHFYFDVCKRWGDKRCSSMVFRAGSYLKINDRKHVVDYALFHQWDYKDAKSAFEDAKEWIFDYIQQLSDELQMKKAEQEG